MNIPYLYKAIIYSASDVTAGIFLMALIVSAALQKNRREDIAELMASAILILAGILLRLFTVTAFNTPDNSLYKYGLKGMTQIAPNVVWSAAAVLIALGIAMSALHVIKINSLSVKRLGGRVAERVDGTATGRAGGRVAERVNGHTTGRAGGHTSKRAGGHVTERLAAMNLVFIVVGVTVFMLTGSNIVYQLAILVQLTALTVFLKMEVGPAVSRDFAIAALPAVILVIFTMATGAIRVSGIGYALIPVALHLQYLARVKEDLVQREADLAKSRVQLLAEQISPHYIYNSLQGISGLCDTDPAKAKTAIDKFSAYLRGNLESLTEEDLIPFQRELLYTESYLDLERVAGDRLFDVQYDFGVTDFMIPPLTLQPVVENAVRHGAPARSPIGTTNAAASSSTAPAGTDTASTTQAQAAAVTAVPPKSAPDSSIALTGTDTAPTTQAPADAAAVQAGGTDISAPIPAVDTALCLIKIATYERDGNIYIEVTDTPPRTEAFDAASGSAPLSAASGQTTSATAQATPNEPGASSALAVKPAAQTASATQNGAGASSAQPASAIPDTSATTAAQPDSATPAAPIATSVPLKPAPSGRSGKSKRKSVGLDNVRTRLAIQTGGTLTIDSTTDGTKVTIMMEKNSRTAGSGRA